MTDLTIKSILLALASTYVEAAIPSGSIADCETFAESFDNTCTDNVVLSDLSTHAGLEVSCIGSMRCPGGSGS